MLKAELELAQLELFDGTECVDSGEIDWNGLDFTCPPLPVVSTDATSSWLDVCSVPSDDKTFDLDSLFVGSSSNDSASLLGCWNFDLDRCVTDMDAIVEGVYGMFIEFL